MELLTKVVTTKKLTSESKYIKKFTLHKLIMSTIKYKIRNQHNNNILHKT